MQALFKTHRPHNGETRVGSTVTRQPFVSSLSTVLALALVGSGAGAQTNEPPGSVPIEPERRAPEQPRRAPAPEPQPPASKVEFVPSDPSVSLLTQSGVTPVAYGVYEYDWWGYGWPRVYRGYTPVYTSMCRGRCTVSMEAGTYELALEKNGRVVPVSPTTIRGDARLNGNFVDRSGTRTTGVVIGVAGTVGGIVMMIAAYHSHFDCDPAGVCVQHSTLNDGLFAAGLGTLIGSLITGSILGSVRDRAELTITPLRLSSAPGHTGVVFDRAVTEGASLSLKF